MKKNIAANSENIVLSCTWKGEYNNETLLHQWGEFKTNANSYGLSFQLKKEGTDDEIEIEFMMMVFRLKVSRTT